MGWVRVHDIGPPGFYPVKYSVAICTWNRAALLTASVRATAAQSSPPEHEILVVDNGSTDNTRQTVEHLKSTVPTLRMISEPRLGLSYARNRALAEAHGEVVIFLDDDARPDPWWLTSIDQAFTRRSEVACLGGPVRLQWPTRAPKWLPSFAPQYFGELDLGAHSRRLGREERPRGLNLAVKRSVALSIGGFRLDLGRRGGSLLSGEDDEFLERLYAAGMEIWWEPLASVTHLVDTARISPQWLMRRAWMQGRGEVSIQHRRMVGPSASFGHSAVSDTSRTLYRAALRLWRGGRIWPDVLLLTAQAGGRLHGHILPILPVLKSSPTAHRPRGNEDPRATRN